MQKNTRSTSGKDGGADETVSRSALNDSSSWKFNKRLDNKSSYRIKDDTIDFIDEEDEPDLEERGTSSDKWKPNEWSDDVRMNALFAPFRSRDLNPLHYDNKLKFWKELILAYCRENDVIQLDVRSAEQWFFRNNVKPKCLDLVIGELAREKRLVTRDEALKPVANGLIQNVFNKFIWTPISWSAGYLFRANQATASQTQLSSSMMMMNASASPSRDSSLLHTSLSSPSSISSAVSSPPTYVVIELLEAKSSQLLKSLQERVIHTNVDTVLDYDELLEIIGEHEKEPDLIVRYLEAQKKIYIDERSVPGRGIVKFTLNSNRHVAPNISEIELSFLKLKQEERKLEADVNRLNNEIENLNTTIKVYLKQGNKTMALKFLKRRKQLEKTAENKDGILTNVQTLIMNIQQADTNKLTYDLFSKGVSALKEANKGMSIDQIDETLDDLHEIIAANVEIEETLTKQSAIPNRYNFDENELNSELNEILAASEDNDDGLGGGGGDTESFNMDEVLKNLPSISNSTTIEPSQPEKTKRPAQIKTSNIY